MASSPDNVSLLFLHLSLSINKFLPGFVSECWIFPKLKEELEDNPVDLIKIPSSIEELKSEVKKITDPLRKSYLQAQTNALETVAEDLTERRIPFREYLKRIIGFEIDFVPESQIFNLRQEILTFSEANNLDPIKIARIGILKKEEIKENCLEKTENLKKVTGRIIKHPKNENFSIELVNNKPWSAFNTHIAPYQSRIEINTDFTINDFRLKLLLNHEIYGGHHSELSSKDKYLVNYGRGEHGIINNFSPQSFISEGIAESSKFMFNLIDLNKPDSKLSLMIGELGNMVSNNSAFYFGQEGWTKEKVLDYRKKIESGLQEEKDIANSVRFDTDAIYSRYAPWYYQASHLIMTSYKKAENKTQFIRNLFNLPLTPSYFIQEEFNNL